MDPVCFQSGLWTLVTRASYDTRVAVASLASGRRGLCGGDSKASDFTTREEGAEAEGERKYAAYQIGHGVGVGFGSAEHS